MRTDRIIGLVGTGIFLSFTLQGISFLVAKILEDALLLTNLKPLLIYGISGYGTLIIVLLAFVYAIKKIKHLDYQNLQLIKKLFLISVLIYFLTQLFGFIYPFIYPIFETTEFIYLKEVYHNSLKGQFPLKNLAIDTPILIIKYAFIVFIILKEIKQFKTEAKPY